MATPEILARLDLRHILDGLPFAVFVKDLDSRYVWGNLAFGEICGCGREALAGRRAADLWGKKQGGIADAVDRALLEGGPPVNRELRIACPCGRSIDAMVLRLPARDRRGRVAGIVGVVIDTTGHHDTVRGLRAAQEKLAASRDNLESTLIDLQSSLAFAEDQGAYLAELAERVEAQNRSISEQNSQISNLMYLDENTGIHNRRYFFDTAPARIDELRAAGQGVLATADIDHFKQVNDSYGHAAGDLALKRFAAVAAACLPPDALFCRIGGEEFAILLPRTDEAETVLETLRRRVEDSPLGDGGHRFSVTVSLGACPLFGGASLDDLLRTSDHALYAAKSGGRNRVCFQVAPIFSEKNRARCAE